MMVSCASEGPGIGSVASTDLIEISSTALSLGPDMVPLPTLAVVGTFHADASLYWTAIADAATKTVMTVGKSVWVLGIHAEGTFYKVLLSGHIAWVLASSMGPNFDDVWNGTPLPTTVVN